MDPTCQKFSQASLRAGHLSQKVFPPQSVTKNVPINLRCHILPCHIVTPWKRRLPIKVSQKGSAGWFDDRVWSWLKEVNSGSGWISSAAPCFKINLIQTMYFCLPLPPTIVKQVSCFPFESLIFRFKVPIAEGDLSKTSTVATLLGLHGIVTYSVAWHQMWRCCRLQLCMSDTIQPILHVHPYEFARANARTCYVHEHCCLV